MDEHPAPPLPWEHKAAIGCLAGLALQEIHEGWLFCIGRHAPGSDKIQSAFALLLVIFICLAAGLWQRGRISWWISVILVGTIAAIQLSDTIDPIRRAAGFGPPAYVFSARGIGECAWSPGPDYFGAGWLIAKNALLIGVPALLLLGELRSRLIRP